MALCCSCGTTIKYRAEKKNMDLAHATLDSLIHKAALQELQKGVQTIQDNSRIKVVKYTPPDSTGKQSVEYMVEITNDIKEEVKTDITKNATAETEVVQQSELEDNSIIEVKEEQDDPPLVAGVRHIMGIIAMLLIAYIIYKFKK